MTAKKTTKKAGGRVTPKKAKTEETDGPLADVLEVLNLNPPAPKPPKRTAAEVLAMHKPVRHSMTFCLDSELADRVLVAQGEARRAAQALKVNTDPAKAAELLEEFSRLDRLRAEAEEAKAEASVEFVAQALPRADYDAIMAMEKYRPTIQQQEEWRKECDDKGIKYEPLSFNPDTFPPALIAACMVEPEFTEGEAQHLWDEWSQAQAAQIFDLCWRTQKIVK